MKFSETWLRQHVPTTASRDELVATLTAIGLEVEEVTAIDDLLEGVVVAQITDAQPHPDADRLQVCTVDAGADAPLQIVCGAPNARVGLKVPLATVGAVLPGGMQIKAAKLRGVESLGMLCSAKELGTDSDAAGLLELPAGATPGAPIADLLGLPDASIEIKLTPNRADCFSVRGIAFDIAAASGSQVSAFDVAPVAATTDAQLAVELDAGGDAPRYCARVISGVDPSVPTPLWMAERLRRSGVRPVSLLVDVTQYVMLELGQPLHAFDRDLLDGPLGVRRARSGESLALLDGRTAELDDDFLVVTDADRPVALAGIMGGFDTRVTDGSRNVLLEAAHFAPAAIIGRGRKLGLHTDAAHRFERGVDPQLPRTAIEYATALVLAACGGAPGPLVEAARPEHLPAPQPIGLRRAHLSRVLGMVVEGARVERILTALGMEVATDDAGWQVTPPSRRFDLRIEEDLVEEVARIHGYDRIPSRLPSGSAGLVATTETRVEPTAMRRQLAARDYLEAINYAFVDADLLAHWGAAEGAPALANPLSVELGAMRTMLAPGLVAALARNVARQQSRVRLFEVGKVFRSSDSRLVIGDSKEQQRPPSETLRVAAVACGSAQPEGWGSVERPVGFHDLKGDLDSLAALSGAHLEYRRAQLPWAHPGRCAQIHRGDRKLGWIAQLHPRLQRALELDVDVVAFELDLELLAQREIPKARTRSKYPSVRRDLAFVVARDVAWGAAEATIRAAAGDALRSLLLFDQYQGRGVESGCKSLAIGLILQEEARTLTDQEVDAAVAAVSAAMQREHAARIRD